MTWSWNAKRRRGLGDEEDQGDNNNNLQVNGVI